jgi:hypothetical protein
MRAREFVVEAKFGAAVDVPATAKKLPNHQVSAIKGAISMPDISMTKQGGSPYTHFAVLTDFQTWVCTFSMLLGRLELFTFLVVLSPRFWD